MTHYACHYLSQDFPKYVPKSTNSVDSPQRLKKKKNPNLKASIVKYIQEISVYTSRNCILYLRRDMAGFFSKSICIWGYNSIFHSFEKHALTRLSLIFKILEQPQSKLIFLKSRADSYKQALLTYQFTGSQRLLCYLQFLTSCFWTLKLKRNASYFFLLLSFP